MKQKKNVTYTIALHFSTKDINAHFFFIYVFYYLRIRRTKTHNIQTIKDPNRNEDCGN